MAKLVDILSGNVPGGILLLGALLIIATLAPLFFQSSKLISKDTAKKTIIFSYVIILGLYSLIWVIARPVPPPKRIIVLPAKDSGKISADNFRFAETVQINNEQLKKGYLIHQWQWLYNTIGRDSADLFEKWHSTALKLDPHMLITPLVTPTETVLEIEVFKTDGSSRKERVDGIQSLREYIDTLNDKVDIFKNGGLDTADARYYEPRYNLVIGNEDRVIDELREDTTVTALILKAHAHLLKGLEFDYNWEKKEFVDITNPDFNRARILLISLVREKRDRAPVAYLLGRMAVREREYENAEIYLKKALVDDSKDPRVYYLMSFLLPSRLEELGYESTIQVLEKAVELDPGYRKAVFELSRQYYLHSTGVEGSTRLEQALTTLEEYLRINHYDSEIQSFLGSLYMKTGKFDKAEKIYTELQREYPDDSNAWYNLGALYYTMGEYKKSLDYFKTSIHMDENLDAYLYTALAYRQLGDDSSALHYFRERVRRKTSDDDPYAREAMKGIREILEKQQNDSL